MIETQNLTYTYSEGLPDEKVAVNDVSISVNRGDFVGIIGHTGSGKSTLIQTFNGLLKPTKGKVLVDGQDIWEKRDRLTEFRFKVGLVFQYPEYQLFEETVYKDIAFGPKNMGVSGADLEKRVQEAAAFVGISSEDMQRSPFDLSGGQKRRAAIAGVLAMDPEVLVLDEPTAGLDPAGRDEILREIEQYHQQRGNTIVLVSHSMDDIARYATKVLVINEGKVSAFDEAKKIFSRAAELAEMGLSIPTVTEVLLALKKRGRKIELAYTMEDAVTVLLRTLKGAGIGHA